MRNHVVLAALLLLLAGCQKMNIADPGNLVHPTTADDPLIPSVEINGVRFHLETFGDIHNPILIFSHGGPGSDYRPLISEKGVERASAYPNQRTYTPGGLAHLQDAFFCVFYDQRGAGLSPRYDRGTITIDTYIEDLDAIADHFMAKKKAETGIQDSSVNLFGWSFGGFITTGYVNTHPEKVKNVILYESRPFNQEIFDLLTLTSPFQQLGQDYVDEFQTGAGYFPANDHNTMDYHQMIGATGNFYPEFNNPDTLPFWRFGYVVNKEVEADVLRRQFSVVDHLNQFQGRMLYLYGEKTRRDAILPGFIEKVLSYYPDARAAMIPGTGHSGVWEQAPAVVDSIRVFLHH